MATDAMERLSEAMDEVIEEKVAAYDFDDNIENACRDFDFDKVIERAVDRHDFDLDIEAAVKDFDFREHAEKAVKAEVEELDLEHTVREVFFGLLKDKEFLERLTAALFE